MTEFLPISELRQLQYCERIPFYHLRLGMTAPSSHRMAEGQAVELRTLALERRRSLAWYKLDEGERSYRVQVSNSELGISGICDLLVSTKQTVIPVEIKAAQDSNTAAHRDQILAYALCLEESLKRAVPFGLLVYVPPFGQRTQRLVEVTPARRRRIKRNVSRLRDIRASEALPSPTKHRQRCLECEFRRFCGDVTE